MADEEKVLLCCSINRAQVVYKIRQRTPRILPISVITCNCSLCEESRNTTRSAIFHSLSDPLFIRAAGYNRSKNLVYFDVFFAPSSSVVHTVECTPRDNQQGIVKQSDGNNAEKEDRHAIARPAASGDGNPNHGKRQRRKAVCHPPRKFGSQSVQSPLTVSLLS